MGFYTVLADARSFVNSLTSVTGRDTIVDAKLQASAGTIPGATTLPDSTVVASGATIYRPYFVAAKILEQNRNDQALSSAEGVKFTNLATMIQSLMDEQLRMDQALSLVVPPGYAAVLNLEATAVMSIMVSP